MRVPPIRITTLGSTIGSTTKQKHLLSIDKPCTRISCFLAIAGFAIAFSGNVGGTAKNVKTSGELKDVQSRIQTLSRDLAKSEERHSDATDQLRGIETSISVATRHLRELADERNAVQAELNELGNQVHTLDKQAAYQQAQLSSVLRSQFAHGDTDALQLLLAGRDPNQAARDEFFMTRLSQAKAGMIRELQGIAVETRWLAESTAARKAQILTIEKKERISREELFALQRKRQVTLAALSGKIDAQRREIGSLKRDEQRLTRLIEELKKIKAARPSGKARVGAGGTPSKPVQTPQTAALSRKIVDVDPGKVTGAFGQLRGNLRMPVTGHIQGRFGTAREQGGTTWKGIFIRADEGVEVRAVAAGTVVFSEWLRGFGNLLVIDHDDDFLSVYGNNQTLLARVGQQVAAGAPVTTVGASGGIAEPGLYFELRHMGRPFDPLKWISGGAK